MQLVGLSTETRLWQFDVRRAYSYAEEKPDTIDELRARRIPRITRWKAAQGVVRNSSNGSVMVRRVEEGARQLRSHCWHRVAVLLSQ